VEYCNESAKTKSINWFNVWKDVKRSLRKLVGFGAADARLAGQKHWDLWHKYLWNKVVKN